MQALSKLLTKRKSKLDKEEQVQRPNPIVGPLRDYINLERYQKHMPAFYNQHYKINLIDVIDHLPPLDNNPVIQLTKVLSLERVPSKNLDCKIEDKLENIELAYAHELDKLNQDVVVNEYQFTKNILGRGAHSVVRLAKHQNQLFAIKIIQFDKVRRKFFIKDEQLIRMINTEMRLLKKLAQCPNVIRHYSSIYSVEKEKMFIVLENCSKGSLLKLAQTEGNFNRKNKEKTERWTNTVQVYFKQLANAISFMHERNVLHRDIKPENVLIDSKNLVKVIDFNISDQVNADGLIRVVYSKFIGTKGYAAPELIISGGKKQATIKGKALDIWALGITLIEVLENRHPLQCRTIIDLKDSIQKQIPINPNYCEDLKLLLAGMLEKQNSRRFTIQQVLGSKWVSGKSTSQNEQTGNKIGNVFKFLTQNKRFSNDFNSEEV